MTAHLVSDDHVAHAAHHAVAVVTIGGPVTPGPGHRPDGDAADTAVTLHTNIFLKTKDNDYKVDIFEKPCLRFLASAQFVLEIMFYAL